MKKKTYEQPRMKVAELEQMDIICTSGPITINNGNGIELDEEEWN